MFDAVSEDVLELVRSSSLRGLVRILAIGTSPDALSDLGPWPLLDAGASDILTTSDTAELADAIAARLSRWEEIEELVRSQLVREALAGRTPAWISQIRQIVEVGRFSDAPVVIIGESGTGKDVVARLIHELDPRPLKGEFVTIDCRMLDPTLARGKLFGFDDRALEGADLRPSGTAGLGAVEAADGGTLFLDNVFGLPTSLRAEALRAIEDRLYGPVGAGDWRRSEFRLICSTSEDTSGASGSGSSAEDFSRRIKAWNCRLLPLREHRDDIPMIAEHLLRRLRPDLGDVRLDQALATFLVNREYPANVHDLQKLVRGISSRHVGPGPVTVGAIPPDERLLLGALDLSWRGEDLERAIQSAVDAGAALKTIGEAARETAIRLALAREEGDVEQAAKRLRVTTRTVASRSPTISVDARIPEAAGNEAASVVELPDSDLSGVGKNPRRGD